MQVYSHLPPASPATGDVWIDDTDYTGSGGGGSTVYVTPYDPTVSRPTGLQGWWRSDLGVTTVGGRVTAWSDQSGGGHNLAASGSGPLAVQPYRFGHSRTAVQGDQTSNSRLTSSLVPATGAAVRTFAIVVAGGPYTPAGSSFEQVYSYGNGSSGQLYALSSVEQGLPRWGTAYWGDQYGQGAYMSPGLHLIVQRYDGTHDELIIDGDSYGKVTKSLNTGSGEGLNVFSRIGSAEYSGVTIYELIAWSALLSDAEVATLLSTWAAYYGVPGMA